MGAGKIRGMPPSSQRARRIVCLRAATAVIVMPQRRLRRHVAPRLRSDNAPINSVNTLHVNRIMPTRLVDSIVPRFRFAFVRGPVIGQSVALVLALALALSVAILA